MVKEMRPTRRKTKSFSKKARFLKMDKDKDSAKFRQFANLVEKDLKAFETSTEWADLIACLQKLNKHLESNVNACHTIPNCVVLSRRLAQCLHPKLPSGVHLMALKTCQLIFGIVGKSTDGYKSDLSQQLHLYTIGLFPLFGLASIKVRKEMLKIFVDHLVPLGVSLQPAVPALLTGVLPALEEGTDFFEATNSFLEQIQKSVGDDYFFECIWYCVLNCPGVRYPALVYVINHVDKAKPMEDQLFIMGYNNGSLMVSSMCSAAEDTVQLVQRNLLELVTTSFPLHSEYLLSKDLCRLVQSCMMVVLKRDMSLNRRLFSWFFGHSVSAASQTAPDVKYFNKYALPLIQGAVDKTLEEGEGEEVAHVCRLFMHLLDREEIGPIVLDKCLFSLLVHTHKKYPLSDASKEANSACKMINLLMTNSLDVSYLWNYLANHMQEGITCSPVNCTAVVTRCAVVCWCLKVIQLDGHIDMRSKHLPQFLSKCLSALVSNFENISKSDTMLAAVTELIEMMTCVLLEISICNYENTANTSTNGTRNELELSTESSPSDKEHPSFQMSTVIGCEGENVVHNCLRTYEKLFGQVLQNVLRHPSSVECTRRLVKASCHFLNKLADFPLYCSPQDLSTIMDTTNSHVKKEYKVAPWLYYLEKLSLGEWSNGVRGDSECQFNALDSLLHIFIVSQSVSTQYNDYMKAMSDKKNDREQTSVLLRPILSINDIKSIENKGLFSKAAEDLWNRLNFGHGREHEKVAQLFLMLHCVYPNTSSPCEDICINHFTVKDQNVRLDAMRKFQLLWSLNQNSMNEDICPGVPYKPFNRCLLTLLHILSTSKDQFDPLFEAARGWLVECVHNKNVPQLITLLCSLLLHPSTCRTSIQYVNIDDSPPPPTNRNPSLIALRTKSSIPLYHLSDMRPCGEHRNHEDAANFLHLRHELMLQRENIQAKGPHEDSPFRRGLTFDEEELVDEAVKSVVSLMLDIVCKEVEESVIKSEIRTKDKHLNGLVIHKNLEQMQQTSLTDSTPDPTSPESLELDYELDDRLCMHLVEGAVEMGAEMEPMSGESPLSPSLSTQLDLSGTDMHHPFHAHMLLYMEGNGVDLARPTQIMQCLSDVLSNNTGELATQIVDSMARTSTNATPRNSQNQRLVEWMAAHVRSITGKCFWSVEAEDNSHCKHYMLLELLITVCLYYIRSYHLNNPCFTVTQSDLQNNLKAKLAAVKLVNLLMQNLTNLVYNRDFASFVGDLLGKCRLQKTLLHCVMATLKTEANQSSAPFSVAVHEFNHEGPLASLASAFQSRLLDAMVGVFELEMKINQSINAEYTANASGIYVDKLSVTHQLPSLQSVPLVDSSLFIISTLNALKKNPAYHPIWLRMVCRALPYMGRSLGDLCQHVCHQLCQNAEDAVNSSYPPMSNSCTQDGREYPTNYLCIILDSLTVIVHHCLLSPASMQMIANAPNPTSSSTSISSVASSVKEGTSLILTNLMRAFTFAEANMIEGSPVKGDRHSMDGMGKAKATLLTLFPHILSPLCRLWSILKKDETPLFPIGSPQHSRKLILDLLSPIAISHPSHFLSALATVWLTKKSLDSPLLVGYSGDQMNIADLLMNLKLLRFESLTLAVAHTLKDPAKINMVRDRDVFPIGLSLLQLLDGCLLCTPVNVLSQSCMSLYQLLMQVLSKAEDNAQVCFLLFRIYCNYVCMCCSEGLPNDSQTVKCLQDACSKLTEAVTNVIGWQLEPNNWFKGGSLVVKSPSNYAALGEEEIIKDFKSRSSSPVPSETSSMSTSGTEKRNKIIRDSNNNRKTAALGTEAMQLLEKNLAGVLDCVFKSDDKDRFTPTLLSLWTKITPFFKTRSANDATNFASCSGLLASLSQYSNTRAVWKKGTMDILCEATFFKMNLVSSKHWLIIVDNLMNDKQTFPDLLKRISSNQTAGLFTSKEMEYEMRALSLKRLAFTLLSSQIDQYYMYLHDVRDRATENLKLYQVASHVHSQVFILFRVLLIRMSPQYLAKMWPAIITELIQVLNMVENKLVGVNDTDYKFARDEQWLQLYFCAIKLLIAFFLVPASHLPSFQMYNWSFSYSVAMGNCPTHQNMFKPLLTRMVDILQSHSQANCDKHPHSTAEQSCNCKLETGPNVNLLRIMSVKHVTSVDQLSCCIKLLSERDIPIVGKDQAFRIIAESVLVDLIDDFL